MYEAARLHDPIAHTSALTGFLIGAVIGIALIAAVAFATFTCGFGVALLAGLAAGVGASGILALGEAIGKMCSSRAGEITYASPNVYINDRQAAFATASAVKCSKHNPTPLVAEGSTNVFINGKPAARKKDAITCGAKIDDGSSNTFIGGGTGRYLPVDDEVPPWLRTAVDWAFALAGLVGGLAGLLKAAGGLSRAVLPCAAKFIAGFVAGEIVGRYVAAPVMHRVMGGLFGQPVDVTTGRKVLLAQEEVDVVVDSPIPVVCNRFYSSNLTTGRTLGQGWVLPWEVRLERRDGRIWHTDAQGRETGFPAVRPGHTAYAAPEQRYLACTSDGRYVVYDLNETYYDFGKLEPAASGIAWLVRVEDQSGQWQSFDRDAQGRVRTIRTSGGVELQLDYFHPKGRLTEIRGVWGGPRGRLVSYGYDEHDQLESVTDANGNVTRRFSYIDGLMASHVNALGFECHYDWEEIEGQARVVACSTSEGERWNFSYDTAKRQSEVRDEKGRTARWTYDENFQITACTDLDGRQYGIEYNETGMPTVLRLPGEREVQFAYDDAGRLVTEIDPLGRTTRTRYDGDGLRIRELVLPDGTTWRAEYDLQGRLLATRDPLGHSERYEYAEGLTARPSVRTDAKGGRQLMEWNRRGQLHAFTDCSGKTRRYEYDDDGRLSAFVNALGERIAYSRRATGEPTVIELPDGSHEQFEYDVAGLPLLHTGRDSRTYRWKRNSRGQVLETVDPAGRHMHYSYDIEGNLIGLRSDNGASYAFRYDDGGRLSTEVRPDGIERHFSYNEAGELTGIETVGTLESPSSRKARDDAREPPRRSMRFERDQIGNLLAQTTETETTKYVRDKGNRLIEAERIPSELGIALGIGADKVQFEYDQGGRLVGEHGVNGSVTYTLDELDNLARLTLPHGQPIDMLRYGSGHVHQLRSGDQIISDFERDDLHREILRTQGQLAQHSGYDALGRKLWQSSATRQETSGPARGLLWRSYRYDAAGELAEQSDSLRGTTQYSYDPAGQLSRVVRLQGDSQERFAWDAAGNLLDEIRRKSRGNVEGNRLRMWQDLRFEYDAWGNLRSKRKGTNQVQHFVYDAQDQLIAVRTENPRGVVEARFQYDPLGRRTAKIETATDAIGLKRRIDHKRFVWQIWRMVQEIRDTGVSSYVYSPDAGYTPIARLDTVIGEALAAATIEAARRGPTTYHFHTDLVGAPLEVTDETGELAWAGKHTAWGKVERGEDQVALARIEQPLRFSGQYADDSTGLHYNTFRYYDPDVGRFINQDPIGLDGGSNLYRYAANPVSRVDPLGLAPIPSFDDLSRMAGSSLDFSTAPDGAVFWSGKNMNAAQQWAASVGKTTLEQTEGGKYLNSLDLFKNMPSEQAAQVWDIASKRFAEGASGTSYVFSTKAVKISPYTGQPRTWWRIEKPALIDNAKVTGVVRMKVDGTPAKNGHISKGC